MPYLSQSNNNTDGKQRRIDPIKLQFSYFNPLTDDFSNLDFKQKDGTDPLNVDRFVHYKLPKIMLVVIHIECIL